MLLDTLLPRVLPAGWLRLGDYGGNVVYQANSLGLRVLISTEIELDGRCWLHVSVSRRSRLPSWEDLQLIKDIFVGRDRTAIQVLPPKAKHVNLHDYCLHLWSCLDGEPIPDFTKGGDAI